MRRRDRLKIFTIAVDTVRGHPISVYSGEEEECAETEEHNHSMFATFCDGSLQQMDYVILVRLGHREKLTDDACLRYQSAGRFDMHRKQCRGCH